jgi:hypothetical protein
MVKRPVVVGLTICKEVIVAKDGHDATLNCIRAVRVDNFPTPPRDYTVSCIVADGLGEFDLTLEVGKLSADDYLYRRTWTISLTDVVREEWLLVTAEKLAFPEAGRYEFVLRIDGEWLAHNTLTLLAGGDSL